MGNCLTRASGAPQLVLAALVLAAALLCAAAGVRAADSVQEHRCGFDRVEALLGPHRQLGISRVVQPATPERGAVVAAAADADAAWQPIRIRVFTPDLHDPTKYCTAVGDARPDFSGNTVTCTADNVLTDSKRQILEKLLIPQAVKMHEDRLNVQRVDGNIVVDASIKSSEICKEFTVPASHMSTGVSDADFVVYLAAGSTPEGIAAWATSCQTFNNGRPSVGVVNVPPSYVSATPIVMRTIAHELLHSLGFGSGYFSWKEMVRSESLRGKPAYNVMVSPMVVKKAQEQYGCPTQDFMELEDQGGDGTKGSHWKRRSAKDELMSPIAGAGAYSAITIAAMEDMGFYKGNYANAEPMAYAQNIGCSLATTKCIVDGAVQFPSVFCGSSSSTYTCATGALAIGRCLTTTHDEDLPSYFQYFSNPKLGGVDAGMDYCPYTYESKWCGDASPLSGSVSGVNSRCFNTGGSYTFGSTSSSNTHALCATVQCDAATSTYSVKVAGASTYTPCTPGAQLQLSSLSSRFSSGALTCQAYDDVCTGIVDEALYTSGYLTSTSTSTPGTTASPTTAAPTTSTPTAAPTTASPTTAAPTTSTTTSASPTTAAPCSVANCQACASGSTSKCGTCNTGYNVAWDGSCMVSGSCSVANCAQCSPINNQQCAACGSGYQLTTAYQCKVVQVSGAALPATPALAVAVSAALVWVAAALAVV